MAIKTTILDLGLDDLREKINSWGLPEFRSLQIWRGLYINLWDDFSTFSDLPGDLRQKLTDNFALNSLTPLQEYRSHDHQTTKILFELKDGKTIESVQMDYDRRRTLCISTQVGCAMGCVFCATGQMGFQRNLTSGEIIEQVLYFARRLKQDNKQVTNIVIMGMGEPFLNYDSTMKAIDTLNHPQGYSLGARHFTISTVGIIPSIKRFTQEKRQVNLAISLHAANDTARSKLLPVNKKYPIATLIDACREYVEYTGRRLTFEWALIDQVNDSIENARELASLLRGLLCHVNIIRLNPTNKYPGKGANNQQADEFRAELERMGIPCTIRLRRGIDINAGCGQLATRYHGQS
jgi:23S rRNA (adenine2503-C2)-methyltransferase